MARTLRAWVPSKQQRTLRASSGFGMPARPTALEHGNSSCLAWPVPWSPGLHSLLHWRPPEAQVVFDPLVRAREKGGLPACSLLFWNPACVRQRCLAGARITGTCCLTSSPLPARHAVLPEQRTSARIRPAPSSSEYRIIPSQWCFDPLDRRQAKPLRFGEAVGSPVQFNDRVPRVMCAGYPQPATPCCFAVHG
ncbi:hypothetical protein BKA80DRAFT_268793 [Phyllosticta citrichinensis]